MNLDSLDQQIIIALENDGRRPYRDIARDLNVAEATIRARVNRLTENKLIRITAVGDPLKLGVETGAISLIRVTPGHSKEVAEKLAQFPNVRFVGVSFGPADIIIQTLHSSAQELHTFLAETVPSVIPSVTSTETFQLAQIVKSSWEWQAWFEQSTAKPTQDTSKNTAEVPS